MLDRKTYQLVVRYGGAVETIDFKKRQAAEDFFRANDPIKGTWDYLESAVILYPNGDRKRMFPGVPRMIRPWA